MNFYEVLAHQYFRQHRGSGWFDLSRPEVWEETKLMRRAVEATLRKFGRAQVLPDEAAAIQRIVLWWNPSGTGEMG